MAGAVPRIGAILRIAHQRAEERRRQRIKIGLRFADNMARDELRRVFMHVNKAMQFAQDVIWNVARGARFAIQINRNFRILVAYLFNTSAQGLQRDFGVNLTTRTEFLVINRQ
jgi:hypothetical protein